MSAASPDTAGYYRRMQAAVEELDTPYQLKLKIDFLEDQLIALKERLHKSASVLTQQLWLGPAAVGLYSEPAIPNQQTRSPPAEVKGSLEPRFCPLSS